MASKGGKYVPGKKLKWQIAQLESEIGLKPTILKADTGARAKIRAERARTQSRESKRRAYAARAGDDDDDGDDDSANAFVMDGEVASEDDGGWGAAFAAVGVQASTPDDQALTSDDGADAESDGASSNHGQSDPPATTATTAVSAQDAEKKRALSELRKAKRDQTLYAELKKMRRTLKKARAFEVRAVNKRIKSSRRMVEKATREGRTARAAKEETKIERLEGEKAVLGDLAPAYLLGRVVERTGSRLWTAAFEASGFASDAAEGGAAVEGNPHADPVTLRILDDKAVKAAQADVVSAWLHDAAIRNKVKRKRRRGDAAEASVGKQTLASKKPRLTGAFEAGVFVGEVEAAEAPRKKAKKPRQASNDGAPGDKAPKKRKNRMGQRARQRLAAQIHGDNANHIKAKKELAAKSRARRGGDRATRKSRRAAGLTGGGVAGDGGGGEAAAADPQVDEGTMHPSWVARRKAHAAVAIGTDRKANADKVVFSSDDED